MPDEEITKEDRDGLERAVDEARHGRDWQIQKLTDRLNYLVSFMAIEDVGDGEICVPGVYLQSENLEDALGQQVRGWTDTIEELIDRAIAKAEGS